MPCALLHFPPPPHLAQPWAPLEAGTLGDGLSAVLTSSLRQKRCQEPSQQPQPWMLMLSLSCWEGLNCWLLPWSLLRPLEQREQLLVLLPAWPGSLF